MDDYAEFEKLLTDCTRIDSYIKTGKISDVPLDVIENTLRKLRNLSRASRKYHLKNLSFYERQKLLSKIAEITHCAIPVGIKEPAAKLDHLIFLEEYLDRLTSIVGYFNKTHVSQKHTEEIQDAEIVSSVSKCSFPLLIPYFLIADLFLHIAHIIRDIWNV